MSTPGAFGGFYDLYSDIIIANSLLTQAANQKA